MKRTQLRVTLLATSSAVAMMAALDGSAAAQCASSNTAPVTNNAPSNCITFYDGLAHVGDVTNNSTLTTIQPYPPAIPGTSTGISVLKSGTILTGNIINNGTIVAPNAGINIGEGATGGANSNAGAVLVGSITNTGSITSSVGIFVAGSSSVLSTVTGSIINTATGLINNHDVGINLEFATVGGSITNAGNITITGSGTAGINVAWSNLGSIGSPGSGNIVNATGARIASTYIGIVLNGNSGLAIGATIAGSITNNGNITSPNQGTAQGIEVAAATALGGVTNNGTINSAIGIGMVGENAGGFSKIASVGGNIVNQGLINAVSTNGSSGGIEIFGHKGGAPAVVGGSIVNSGTISAAGVSGSNDGILLAGARVAGGITNTGTITVSGGGGAVNVGIAVAKTSAANFLAVYSSIGGSINNQGTISAGTAIAVSGGSILGGGITNSGNLSGTVAAINLTGEGAPTTINVIGGAITGNIIGAGADTLNFALGSATFTYNSSFTGINQVNISSGTVILNATDVANSVLVSGGTLAGIGTLNSVVSIASGGTFSPGTPGTPGTSMNIVGGLTFAAGATYQIYVNPSTSTFATVSAATLGGAGVNASFANGSYISRQYTILTAGTIAGTFGTLTNNNLPSNFTDSLSYDPNHVYLNLTLNFTPAPNNTGLNGNQANVANALIRFFNTNGSIPAVFGNLTANGLTQLSGEAATDAEKGAFELMNQFMLLMLDPFVDGRFGGGGFNTPGFAPEQSASFPPEIALAYDSVFKAPPKTSFDQRWTAWGSGFGGSSTVNGNAAVGSNNVTARDYGFAGGMDYHFSPNSLVGFAVAGGGTSWNLAQGLGGGRSDAFLAGVYGKTFFGPAYLAGALAYGNNWFTTNRLALGDNLSATFNGQSYGGRAEAGYRYGLAEPGGPIGVTPYAALQTQWFQTPRYSEADFTTGGFGLTYNAMTANDTRSELGARFDDLTSFSGMPLVLRGRLAWAHDWVTNPALGAVFQSLPGASFTVNGAAPPPNSLLASAGAELHITRHWSAMAKFDGEFASGAQTYAGTGTLRYTW